MWLAIVLCSALPACRRTAQPEAAYSPVITNLHERLEDAPEFGGQVYVIEAGPATAPPLVLIHGAGQSAARDFEPLFADLSVRYHVLSFDLPGFGRSTRVARVYSPARYVRFVRALIARHLPRPVAVLGHSMGGALAIEFAANHPELVNRLALLDVAGILHYRDYLRTLVRAEHADDGFFAKVGKQTRSVLFEIGWWPVANVRLEDLGLSSRPGRTLSASQTAALLLVQHDFGPALRKLRAPTAIGWGRYDQVAPLRTAQALRYLLGSELQMFERSAHTPMRSEPGEVLRWLEAFLTSDPRAPSPAASPLASARVGKCERERDRIFEGDYDRIEVYRCKRVLLRNVRARALRIERSEVELSATQITGGDLGAFVRRSRLRWTGGEITAATCLDTDHSKLNLLAVRCTFTRESLRVRMPSQLVASISELRGPGRTIALHGDYELFRTWYAERREDSVAEDGVRWADLPP